MEHLFQASLTKFKPNIGPRKNVSQVAKYLFLAVFGVSFATAQDKKQLDDVLPIPSSHFIPPPPPKKVPPMVVEASSVLKSKTHQITVLRGDASTLPDIPPPPEPKPYQPSSEGEPHYVISFGATVYDHQLSHVNWYDPRTKETFDAWCAWDWTLLSPITKLKFGEKTSSFNLFTSNIDTSKGLRFGKETKVPKHPALQENAFAITKGNGDNKEAIRAITVIRDYYLKHRERLLLIREAQVKYQQEAAAWYAANPPKPQNHTFWLKPHRGSRYLIDEGGAR